MVINFYGLSLNLSDIKLTDLKFIEAQFHAQLWSDIYIVDFYLVHIVMLNFMICHYVHTNHKTKIETHVKFLCHTVYEIVDIFINDAM